ncbi:T9SS type A sorting domain-containing protein [Nibrella saemangeumensis]
MANLQRISNYGSLIIQNNPQLISLAGLNSLISIERGDLLIQNNPELTSLTGLEKLTEISRSLNILNNVKLTSIAALARLDFLGYHLQIQSNPELTSLTGLGNLRELRNGDLSIINNSKLTSLTGLNGLYMVGGVVRISNNSELTSLVGLNNLTAVGEVMYPAGMYISGNAKLSSLAGLSRLSSVGEEMQIVGNPQLTSLTGLEKLTKIGYRGSNNIDFRILNNAKLANIAALSRLASVGRDVRIQNNPELTSLTGLEMLTSIGGNLLINNNAKLTTCAIASVCQFVAAYPDRTQISGNAPGCATLAEVQANCNPNNSPPTLLTQAGGATYPAGQSAVTVPQYSGPVVLEVQGCPAGTTIAWTGPNGSSGSSSTIQVPTTQTGTFVYSASCQLGASTSPSASATVVVQAAPLQMIAPVYSCATRQLTLRTTGGNGGVMEYQIASVTTGWESVSSNTFIVQDKHIGQELKLRVRQRNASGGYTEVSISFTPTACSNATARVASAEQGLEVMVLGNPMQGEQVRALVRGAGGQRLWVEVVNLQGRAVAQQQVEQAQAEQDLQLEVGRTPGVYLLRVSTTKESQTVRLLKAQ